MGPDEHSGDATEVGARQSSDLPTIAETPRLKRPTSPGSREGQVLGHYRLEELIGAGGLGEVYKATDLSLDRTVAVKVLAAEVADSGAMKERLYREARAQARINHPNVCHVYYVGEQAGDVFFAMEYVEGETLRELIDRGSPLPPDKALEYCRMAAHGLREAHRHGIVHRDIKPSNLVIADNGVLKIVDFGLVKFTSPADISRMARLTARGEEVLGTPYFMAPEQAESDETDFRADIYALGATLHCMLAGSPPFTGGNPVAVMSKQLDAERPRLPRLRLGRGEGLDELCDRMMAKRPADRFQSYDQLLAHLGTLSVATSRPAGFFLRTGATLIDVVIVVSAGTLLGLLTPALEPKVYKSALFAAYYLVGHAILGVTVGKKLLGIEVVRTWDGDVPGFRCAAVRLLLEWGPSYLILGVGDYLELEGPGYIQAALAIPLLAMAWGVTRNHRNRAYWDKAAGSIVRHALVRRAR